VVIQLVYRLHVYLKMRKRVCVCESNADVLLHAHERIDGSNIEFLDQGFLDQVSSAPVVYTAVVSQLVSEDEVNDLSCLDSDEAVDVHEVSESVDSTHTVIIEEALFSHDLFVKSCEDVDCVSKGVWHVDRMLSEYVPQLIVCESQCEVKEVVMMVDDYHSHIDMTDGIEVAHGVSLQM